MDWTTDKTGNTLMNIEHPDGNFANHLSVSYVNMQDIIYILSLI